MATFSESSELSEENPSQRFFRYFQLEATALQQQIDHLEDVPAIGGERVDAIDHCLAGIARLQREVQDAASYTTSYDQRMYSEGIKALREKLDAIRAVLAPRSKFSFKSSIKKNESAISLGDAAELAMQQRAGLLVPRAYQRASGTSSTAVTPAEGISPSSEPASRPAEPLRRGSLGSFLQAAGVEGTQSRPTAGLGSTLQENSPSAGAVKISSQSHVHIVLPSSAAHANASGSLTDLQRCFVVTSIPTATGEPLAGLTIKDVKKSLLVCGNVDGAVHVTNVKDSVILVTTRQFRMHDCTNCIVYLHVNSRPIIERCKAIRFAPLPTGILHLKGNLSSNNEWDQVQDFNWLKSEPSPNWTVLPNAKVVQDDKWADFVNGGPNVSLDEVLRAVGVAGLNN